MKRKIAAILAADAVEYSRLVAENEEEALLRLVASIGVFKTSIEAHGGRIFNTAGDAVLAEFQSPVEAVHAAIDIQHTLTARNEECSPKKRMMFRMGISIGDVVENGGDLLGDGVNIAARLQGLSQPGGLAISKWVQEQVAGKVTTEFRDAGQQFVKNMPAPIHVFQASIGAGHQEPPTTVPLATPVRRWPIRSLAAGFAALMVAAVFFVLTQHDPAAIAIRDVLPISTKQEGPAPLSPIAIQSPHQPTFVPRQTFENTSPGQSVAPKREPAAVETPARSSSTPPPAAVALPVGGDSLAASVAREPIEAILPPAPVAPAPESGRSATLRNERSPEAVAAPAPVPAQESAADRKRQKVQCAQVLERAQLGDLTLDDQAFLRSKCR